MFEPLSFPLPVAPNIRKGRVPHDGYQRGWGIQFGGLLRKIQEEDAFKRASENISDVSCYITMEKRANLYLLITRYLPLIGSQDIIEFGSFRGAGAIFMATALREVSPSAKLYALDTFEGMPKTDYSVDAHNVGDFSETSIEEVMTSVNRAGLDNIVLVKGLFEDTFPSLSKGKIFGLAHIDADIYSAVKYAQNAVWPYMTRGGYVAYDDADASSCLGATEAVEDLIMDKKIHSEQIYPHFVFRAGL